MGTTDLTGPDHSLALASDAQLLAIYHAIVSEIRKRRKSRDEVKRFAFKMAAIEFEKSHGTINEIGSVASRDIRIHRRIPLDDLRGKVGNRLKYLKLLLAQDWENLFGPGLDEREIYYVYAHIDPYEPHVCLPTALGGPIVGMPFYIGKGSKGRAFDLSRNQGHGLRLRQLIARGNNSDSLVKILCRGLSERAALSLEAKLIYFFGTIYEVDRNGVLLNMDTSVRPNFKGDIDDPSSKKKRKKP